MEPTSEQKVIVLKSKLQNLFSDIKEVVEQGRRIDKEPDALGMFQGMFRSLDTLYEKFNTIWDDLVLLHVVAKIEKDFPTEKETSMRQSVKRYYYECGSLYEKLLSPNNQLITETSAPNMTLNTTTSQISRSRLPKITLKQFDGNLSNWTVFRDMYLSLVHNDINIPAIEKFHYLVGSLSGSAITLIKAIPIIEANYTQAWETLIRHFDNKRKLASSYLTKVMDFKPNVGKPTAKSLKDFFLTMSENVQAFNNLEIENAKEFILFELAIRSLDPTTREDFEMKFIDIEFPTFQQLIRFVETRYQALTLIAEIPTQSVRAQPFHPTPNKFQPNYSNISKNQPSRKNTSFFVEPSPPKNQDFSKNQNSRQKGQSHVSSPNYFGSEQQRAPTCTICRGYHKILDCPTYRNASPEERMHLVKRHTLCINCLHPKHLIKQCTSKSSCQECGTRHHTTLHIPKQNSIKAKPSETTVQQHQSTAPHATIFTSINYSNKSNNSTYVILGTAIAMIQDVSGAFQPIRLVIDSGSQYSFVTKQCAKRLGLKIKPFSTSIAGVGEAPLIQPQGKTSCYLKSCKPPYCSFNTDAVVVSFITSYLPQQPLPTNIKDIYQSLELADPNFYQPGPVDFLLGVDLFTDILSQDLPQKDCNLLSTVFGYVVMGKFESQKTNPNSVSLFSINHDLNNFLTKFWEIEEVVNEPELSVEAVACENHFKKTHYRLPSGRYVVSLPFKNFEPKLGSSKERALKRLFSLENKLHKSEELRIEYNKFLMEYLELGHMSKASSEPKFVIPHQPVFKSEIGKLRVVFDASSKTSLGSLNDHLMVGPKLHNDITHVVMNFRRHRIVFTSDIVKMFRQIYLHPADRAYQHILWRFSPENEIEEFELNTITYGTAPAPYLSIRCLHQLVEDEGYNFPLAAPVILNDIYVDDIATGGDSVEEALIIKQQLVALLSKGCFQLSKWASNSAEILKSLENGSVDKNSCVDLSSVPDDYIKVLGMQWHPTDDVFKYQIQTPVITFTKRAILSTIARIYDPLGYLSPIIFFAKQILQETWKITLDWDSEVPANIRRDWTNFITDLPNIQTLEIPRYLKIKPQYSVFHLLGFSDASQKGLCAALYLRVENSSEIQVFLLKSKTKLAPLKPLTIPRLELCAAELLAKLFLSMAKFLDNLPSYQVFLFTDASIVLSWLHTPPHMLKIFVCNRVAKILELTKLEWWRHVRTEENPADCGSRGVMPSNLINHPLWWSGPPWAVLPYQEWPSFNFTLQEDLPEIKSSTISLMTTSFPSDIDSWTKRFSRFDRLVRSFAYAIRFVTKRYLNNSGPITANEFEEALLTLVKVLQKYYYPNAFGNNYKVDPIITSLNVFIDNKGLLRVGGRITKSNLSFDQKHQILLPKRSHFTSILVDHYHREHFHIGPTSLQAIINQKFWIPSARNLIRHHKSKCITCIRLSKTPKAPFMGNLPASRFHEIRAFYKTGVDFAGPFICRESSRRKSPTIKTYLCLFICMSTRAVHLEIVLSLTTEAFLNVLDRFVSRRGLPSEIISDRGTNFVGASNYLIEIAKWLENSETQNIITSHLTPKHVKWTFNPPYSPHFGGSWEAGVKVAKNLMHKMIANYSCTVDELTTLFIRIEGIMNSRPLTALSNDPDDLQPLTPGHFLIGGPITAVPEIDFMGQPENRLSRWQLLKERLQYFWERWRKEYITSLQQRKKWIEKTPPVKVGDLVLLQDLNTSPMKWPLARISKLHTGDDGITRVVTLKTPSGQYQRPLTKIVNLEIQSSETEPTADHF